MTSSQPSPMTGFSHVQLLVSDVQASEQWYTTVLGLERFAADDAIGYVALRHKPSGVAIVLSTREHSGGADTALDHLAFAVPDGAILEEWADHLTRAGIEHNGIVLELGKPSLQLRDPDGNAIELVAPAPRTSGKLSADGRFVAPRRHRGGSQPRGGDARTRHRR